MSTIGQNPPQPDIDVEEVRRGVQTADELELGGEKVIGKTSIIVRRFLRNRTAVVGLSIFILLIIFALVGQFFTPWKLLDIDSMNIGMPPSSDHLLGTTQGGRDVYISLVEGLRTSIIIGLVVGIGATFIGAVYGCTMAYFGGRVEKVMLFILEALIMVPTILLVALVTSGGGGALRTAFPSWILLTIVLVVLGWMGGARLIRSLGASIMTREYVKSAQFMGVSPFKIIWRHLVPNIGSLIVLEITRGVSAAILSEVAFSFIGVGVRDPNISLGVLIGQASAQLDVYPWMFWVPLITMFLLTGSMALMNDGLRDAFDPSSSSVGKTKKKKNLK